MRSHIRHRALWGLLAAGLLAGCETADGAARPITGAPPDAVIVEAMDVRAARSFAGPTEFPPSQFAGYGILAFPSRPGVARGEMFCRAFESAMVTSEDLTAAGVPEQEQMVTVWPIRRDDLARMLRDEAVADPCRNAVRHYGLLAAQDAIADARQAEGRGALNATLSGRGPFLLAWAPGTTKEAPDALVLISDLSNVEDPMQAQDMLVDWVDDIQRSPELWRDGLSAEGLRVAIRNWADRYGAAILQLLGVSSGGADGSA